MDSQSEKLPDVATVDLVAPGGVVHQLRQIGTNELCALEETLARPFGQLMTEVGAFGIEHMRLSTVRAFIAHALATPLNEEQVGRLIDVVGFDGIAAAINQLVIPAQVGKLPAPPPGASVEERTH